MTRKYPNLCSPLKIGNVTLRNRMVSAPMAFPDITAEGHVTKEAAAFYELRAKGGAAAVTLSECIVHIKTGMSHSRHIKPSGRGCTGRPHRGREVDQSAMAHSQTQSFPTAGSMQPSTWRRARMGKPTSDTGPARRHSRTAPSRGNAQSADTRNRRGVRKRRGFDQTSRL